MKLRTTLPVLAAVAALGAGCSSGAVEPAGLTASPTVAVEPTPTPTPSPGPGLEPSDPELGIVFEDVPELSGPQVEVFNTVAAFSKEYWRMMTSNTASPGFDVLASPEVRAVMESVVAQNIEQDLVLAGVFHTRISDVVIDGDTASATVCDDYREVIGTDPNGTYSSQEIGLRNLASHLTLGPSVGGTWIVLSSDPAGAC